MLLVSGINFAQRPKLNSGIHIQQNPVIKMNQPLMQDTVSFGSIKGFADSISPDPNDIKKLFGLQFIRNRKDERRLLSVESYTEDELLRLRESLSPTLKNANQHFLVRDYPSYMVREKDYGNSEDYVWTKSLQAIAEQKDFLELIKLDSDVI